MNSGQTPPPGTPVGADDAEQLVFQRVLDALLREDHLGLWRNGRPDGPDRWLTRTPVVRLRIPVRPDGFQHPVRSAGPELTVLPQTGPERPVRTLDGLLDLLAPTDDPEAEAGWADFRAECRADLAARRLAARTAPRVYAQLRTARGPVPDGMAGALRDDVLAARTDHPVYPTSRCRYGLDEEELLRYAPEHAPTFVLRWTPVPRTELTLTGQLPAWWPAARSPDTVLLPVHPLTAARYDLPVVDDAPDVPVRPTLSMRTVALVDDPDLRLKLPLPTATLGARNRRTIAPGTLADGAALQRLLDRIAAAEPAFAGRILHADESCHGQAGGDGVRAFLLRRFPSGLAGCRVVPVAALAAVDPDGGTVAQRVGGPDPRPLLDAYLDLLLDWHGHLWLRHGIALEAHQQNIHLVLDPADREGVGLRLLYQDNDGARLAPRPGVELRDARMWVTDPGELADVFSTITLHLAAAAPLRDLAGHGLPVPSPGAALRPRLTATRDRWAIGPAGFPGDDASAGAPVGIRGGDEPAGAGGQRADEPAGAGGQGGDEPGGGWDVAAAARMLTERVLDADRLPVKAMVTAGTLLPKTRTGCADINKYYRRTGPNYLRPDR
ncbi:IucA/IucC family protein [Plantactinospora sonchi]|uniref:IucA/IucC family protein n=1 Tax=Plantactinospora sonchi TaxID=1544735 RepID=A0ABU7RL61_9ACTN